MKLVSVLVAATSLGAATAASSNNNFRGSGKSNYSRQLEYDATSTTDQSTSVGQTLMYLLANFVMMPMDLTGKGCPPAHPPPKKKSGSSSGGHSSWSSGSDGYKWNDGSRRSLSENDWNGGGGDSSYSGGWSGHSSSGSSSKKKPPPPRCEHPHAPAPKKKSSSKSHSSSWNDDGHGWDNDGYSYQNEYHSKESWSFVVASLLASAAIGAAGFAAKNKCKGGMFPSQGSDKPANDDSMDNETVDSDLYEPSPSSYVEMTDPSTQQLRVSIPPPPQPQQSSKFGNLSKKIRSITIMRK